MIRRYSPPDGPHQSFLGDKKPQPMLATPIHKPSFGVRPVSAEIDQLQAALRKLRER